MIQFIMPLQFDEILKKFVSSLSKNARFLQPFKNFVKSQHVMFKNSRLWYSIWWKKAMTASSSMNFSKNGNPKMSRSRMGSKNYCIPLIEKTPTLKHYQAWQINMYLCKFIVKINPFRLYTDHGLFTKKFSAFRVLCTFLFSNRF